MCGILGYYFFDLDQDTADPNRRLKTALDSLNHRGPDDRGIESFRIYFDANHSQGILTLGHTRLSIIDLSPGGHQPMQSIDGRYTIVFNGEIYNYREIRQELIGFGYSFRTESDTEVLIAAWAHWGVEGLRRLTGMFAFAIFDRLNQTLTLVRDAFGIKPIYYSFVDHKIFFASEISPLLILMGKGPRANIERAYQFIIYGRYENPTDTFFKNIVQLPPRSYLEIDLTSHSICHPKVWWNPSIEENSQLSFNDAADCFRELFLKNVRLHLRSDVPFGAALSGGVDSSAIVCAIRHIEPQVPLHTFTYKATGSNLSEEYWADRVNSYTNSISHKIEIRSNEFINDMHDLIRTQGEPFGTTSIYAQYRVFRKAKEAGITVILDGQGADELLAGYDGYPDQYIRSLLDRNKYTEALRFILQWSKWPDRSYKRALFNLGESYFPRRFTKYLYNNLGRNVNPLWLNDELLNDENINLLPPMKSSMTDEGDGRRLSEKLRDSLTNISLPLLLRFEDRNSMRWSIESRVPFLTTETAEFLLSLPESFLLSPTGETKRIFRAAMRDIVPDEILERRDKIGFVTPEGNWINDDSFPLKDLLSYSNDIPLFNFKELQSYLERATLDQPSYKPEVWRALQYITWMKEFNVSI